MSQKAVSERGLDPAAVVRSLYQEVMGDELIEDLSEPSHSPEPQALTPQPAVVKKTSTASDENGNLNRQVSWPTSQSPTPPPGLFCCGDLLLGSRLIRWPNAQAFLSAVGAACLECHSLSLRRRRSCESVS
jgi:hypothetical protein